MQFPIVRQYKTDIRCANPENKVKAEPFKTPAGDSGRIIVPRHAPFFASELEVTTLTGEPMFLDVDYRIHRIMGRLTELTSQDVACFVEFLKPDITEGLLWYHVVGEFSLIDNSLLQLIAAAINDDRPVYWDNLQGKPAVFPPKLHPHSLIYDIVSFQDMIDLLDYTLGVMQSNRKSMVEVRIEHYLDLVNHYIKVYGDMLKQFLANHVATYNEHGLTAEQVVLEKVDNFETANEITALLPRRDLHLTVLGLRAIMKAAGGIDPQQYLKANLLPISSYGSSNPESDVSMGGAGTESECSGINVDPDGSLVMLSNHFDGRVRGLFFSKTKNYNTNNPKHSFTGVQYVPANLASLNLAFNRVVMGSGPKAIMIGVDNTNSWYVALTAGTLYSQAHAFVKCDVSAIANFINDPNKPNYNSSHRAVIHHMGAYLVLVQTYNIDVENSLTRQAFFRVLASDVVAGRNVTWTRFNVSYTTWAGVALSAQQYMELGGTSLAGGKILRVGAVTGSPEITRFTTEGRVVSLSAVNPNDPALFGMTFLVALNLSYVAGVNNKTTRTVLELRYDFNPATGEFILKDKSPALNHAFLTSSANQADQYAALLHTMSLSKTKNAATVLLSTGELVSSLLFKDQSKFPIRSVTVKMLGRSTPEAVLGGMLNASAATVEYSKQVNPAYLPATMNGTHPAGLVYQANGELYAAVNPLSLTREVYFRQVTGGFQVQELVKNLIVGDVNARPLGGQVYPTNLLHHDPMMNFTATAALLAPVGSPMGIGSFGMCGYSSVLGLTEALPTNPAFRAVADEGVVISFPRTVTQVLSNSSKKATYTGSTFYGMKQSIIDQLRGYVPANSVTGEGWCFTLYMLNAQTSGGLTSADLAVVQVCWKDETTGYPRTQLILALPIVETPNTQHPHVYLITSLQILDTPDHSKSTPYTLANDKAGMQFRSYKDLPGYMERPMMTGYLSDASSMKCFLNGGFYVNVGWELPLVSNFDINLTTKEFANIGGCKTPMGFGDQVTAIPNVGVTDYQLDVIPAIPPTYVPPTLDTWVCSVSGRTTTNARIVNVSEGGVGPVLTPDLVRIHAGEGGSGGTRVADCVCNNGVDIIYLRSFVDSHFRRVPSVTPPTPAPEKWVCKTSNTVGTAYRLLGSERVPKALQLNPTLQRLYCTSCGTSFAEDITEAGYLSVRDSHYNHIPEEVGWVVTPGVPGEAYVSLPAGEFHANTGGAAAIARKTVGSAVSYYMMASLYPVERWIIPFQEVQVVFNGTAYTMPATTIDLRVIDSAPANKTFYVYARLKAGVPVYEVSQDKRLESPTQLWVGTAVTNALQIASLERFNVFTLDGHRISETKRGYTIPASSGPVNKEGQLPWLRTRELLP